MLSKKSRLMFAWMLIVYFLIFLLYNTLCAFSTNMDYSFKNVFMSSISSILRLFFPLVFFLYLFKILEIHPKNKLYKK